MQVRRPHVASLDQVRISRAGDDAVIEYADPHISPTHLKLGPDVQRMTDQEIVDRYNEILLALDESTPSPESVAVEIPPGQPQIERSDAAFRWTPRGEVLRCVIGGMGSGPRAEPVIHVDDQALSLSEFGRLLLTREGWGMRVTFVPEDTLQDQPLVEVREPAEGRRR